MFFVVGLGNPGHEYENTRHNIGFMVVDRLATSLGIALDTKEANYIRSSGYVLRPKGPEAEATVEPKAEPNHGIGAEVMLVKPQTFMNLSGNAARALAASRDLTPDKLIVVCDDCELPLGKIRIRKGGGSGGQRGLASIIERLGTNEFVRVRMGVGRPAEGSNEELRDYVLDPFTEGEAPLAESEIKSGATAVESIIIDGIDAAMNRFN